MENIIRDRSFDEERELYGIRNAEIINCRMEGCDLSFEKSEVDAEILSRMDSIKNPASGKICLPEVGEIIMDDPSAKGEVIIRPDV